MTKPAALSQLNPQCAGIDVGAAELFVCIAKNSSEQEVRSFSTFTSDMKLMRKRSTDLSQLKRCRMPKEHGCPGNKVSGGKVLSSKTKPSDNKAAQALRMAASCLYRSTCYLGAFYRRMRSRLGAPKAITATAHKLAKTIYRMLVTGEDYRELGENYYEQQYQDRVLTNLKKRAKEMGYNLTPVEAV